MKRLFYIFDFIIAEFWPGSAYLLFVPVGTTLTIIGWAFGISVNLTTLLASFFLAIVGWAFYGRLVFVYVQGTKLRHKADSDNLKAILKQSRLGR
ncbi:hypothetical protein [Asticcacaulis sp. YBE204]|uniref:hypothetical protein n=1 Tax=Asticcacaulis sp. YBE204 TaxID=1282363 RepID=UPI0003C3B530|nr:hypothetical protein [Asticcacaulis sp. YBE204]ESQ79968.1 hypothetical protein AEYBE204_08965 [Asticcacaulis sp. YBE204]